MIRIFSQYVSPKSVFLVGLETLLIGAALVGGVLLRFWNSPAEAAFYIQAPEFAWQTCAFIVVFQICFYYCDVYGPKAQHHPAERWLCLWQALGAGSVLLGLIYFAMPGLLIGRGVFFISVALVPILVIADRLILETAWHAAASRQNLLIIGTQDLARTLARELARHDDLSVNVAGFVATELDASNGEVRDQVLGTTDQLEAITAEHQITRIVVALEDRRGSLPVRELVKLRVQGIRVEEAHSMLASLSGRVWLRTVQPSWFVFSDGFRRSRLTSVAKRTVDLSCGMLGLILSLPVMAAVALAIRLDSKGPVLYRQRRVGLRGRQFDVLKFRSMRQDAEQHNGAQWAQEDDPRITRAGRVLRKYRLDELPQFVNVIRGEMSFVGPRPERPVFVERLRREISYYDERHSVRPGLTGWAQVEYRYGASSEDARRKLEYDLFYLKNMSILFDFAIIFKTVRIVLGGDGSR
jgi:sugar transferase (PEP-CTERM system associated)